MAVKLIDAPFEKSIDEGYELRPPALGLVTLYSYLKERGVNVEAFDLRDNFRQKPEFKLGDIVGCSDLFTNHRRVLEVLKEAKAGGATTVMGGPNCSNMPDLIASKYDFIDHIVVGDGTIALEQIVAGRIRDRIIYGSRENLDTLPLLDLEPFTSVVNWDSRRPSYSEEGMTPFPVSFVRGCIKKQRCPYCAIPSRGVRITNPIRFWQQIQHLKKEYGIRYFMETGDDFLVGNYPQKIAEAKPVDLYDIKMRIYARPEDKINWQTLKKIGVSEIFFGVEHVNPGILRYIGKKHDSKTLFQLMEQARKYQIKAHLAFLFGLPGETRETARENSDFASNLIDSFGAVISRVLFSFAQPLIGSRWFDELISQGRVRKEYTDITGKDLSTDDAPDYPLLSKLSCDFYSQGQFSGILEEFRRGKQKVQQRLGRQNIAGFGLSC
jgi:radical SAM superfamily enzyme YgiQ (UPF0313 family)